MSTVKAFISQPMRDKTDEQILAERTRAIKTIKKHIAKTLLCWTRFSREHLMMLSRCGF